MSVDVKCFCGHLESQHHERMGCRVWWCRCGHYWPDRKDIPRAMGEAGREAARESANQYHSPKP
jgi:hypothetical protein